MPSRIQAFRRLVPIVVATCCLTGCVRRVQYTAPDGRSVDVLNVGFDTKLGRLEAITENGSLVIEGAESEAALAKQLATVAADLAAVARAAAEGGAK
jgi:hypothetical protein